MGFISLVNDQVYEEELCLGYKDVFFFCLSTYSNKVRATHFDTFTRNSTSLWNILLSSKLSSGDIAYTQIFRRRTENQWRRCSEYESLMGNRKTNFIHFCTVHITEGPNMSSMEMSWIEKKKKSIDLKVEHNEF